MLKQDLIVKKIPFNKYVIEFISKNHYTKTSPRAVVLCFGVFNKNLEMVGACLFGSFSRLQSKIKYDGCLELSRLFIDDNQPKNSESFVIGQCLRWIKKNTDYDGIISYSDRTEGHTGLIYRASNFTHIGVTGKSYHYLDQDGLRIHKKIIWKKAKQLAVKERDYASLNNLKKIIELEKDIFKFSFNRKKTRKEKSVSSNAVILDCYNGDGFCIENIEFDKVFFFRIGEHVSCTNIEYKDFVLSRKWYVSGGGYVCSRNDNGTNLLLHRYINKTIDGMVCDHINRNRLDNRFENLRQAHQSLNNHNKDTKDGCRGIRRKKNSWESAISFNGKRIHLGSFPDKNDAMRAYDLKAVEIYGKDAQTNFPIEMYAIPDIRLVDSLGVNKLKRVKKARSFCIDCGRVSLSTSDYCKSCDIMHKRTSDKKYNIRVPISSVLCSEDGCNRKNFASNLCNKHYLLKRKLDGVTYKKVKPRCSFDGCGKNVVIGGMCVFHYKSINNIPLGKITGRPKSTENRCFADGCRLRANSSVFCSKHRKREIMAILSGRGVSDILMSIIEKAGISKTEFCRTVGMKTSYFSNIISGKSHLKEKYIDVINKKFGIFPVPAEHVDKYISLRR